MVQRSVPNMEGDVIGITSKLPAIQEMEKKIPMFKELQPELKKLTKDLEGLEDFSEFEVAKEGGNTIKNIYKVDKLPFLTNTEKNRWKETVMEMGHVAMQNVRYEQFQDQSVEDMENHIERLEREADAEERQAAFKDLTNAVDSVAKAGT